VIICIGCANYSYRYRLQPILLIIGPITRMADVSVQLYYGAGAESTSQIRSQLQKIIC